MAEEKDLMGYPLIVLSHRRREFLETTLASIDENAEGVSRIIVVDDSGDTEHHEWVISQGLDLRCSSPDRSAVGYLGAMQTLWEVGWSTGADHILLWEEDFVLTERVCLADMAAVLEANPMLAQLNLQRQPVYKIERRFGYMQSHQRRGYDLASRLTSDIAWVRRARPFTTNPGMIPRHVLEIPWPYRVEADRVAGGAEPAMSQKLERLGYHFGWLGIPNHPHTEHVGTLMKSGKGY